MPETDLDLVLRTARLARIALAPDEAPAVAADFRRVLDAFRALADVDVEGVEPLVAPDLLRALAREDRVVPSEDGSELLRRAPDARDGWYAVPPVSGEAP